MNWDYKLWNRAYKLSDYLTNFNQIMPQIVFNYNGINIDSEDEDDISYASTETDYSSDEDEYEKNNSLKHIKKNTFIDQYTSFRNSFLNMHWLPNNFQQKDPLFKFFNNPKINADSLIYHLNDSLIKKGHLFAHSYYLIIFLIEFLNNEKDAIKTFTRIMLEHQLMLELNVLNPLVSFYSEDFCPTFDIDKVTEKHSKPSHNINVTKLTHKFVKLVEEHLIRIKSNLINSCLKESISPIRTMWLYAVPLTFDELHNMLLVINNKYIRASLFWVAGFQKVMSIRNDINFDIERTAFDCGLECKLKYEHRLSGSSENFSYKKHNLVEIKEFNSYNSGFCDKCGIGSPVYNEEDCEQIIKWNNNVGWNGECDCIDKISLDDLSKRTNFLISTNYLEKSNISIEQMEVLLGESERKYYYGYHPFYKFTFTCPNWTINASIELNYYLYNFSKIALEYKNYYNNSSYESKYFLHEDENTNFIPHITNFRASFIRLFKIY